MLVLEEVSLGSLMDSVSLVQNLWCLILVVSHLSWVSREGLKVVLEELPLL